MADTTDAETRASAYDEQGSVNTRLSARWVNPQPLNMAELIFGYGSSPKCPHCPNETAGTLHPQLNGMVIWPDLDGYDSPAGTRGEFILIPLYCEICGRTSALTIGNHKGNLYLTMLSSAPPWDKPGPGPWGDFSDG